MNNRTDEQERKFTIQLSHLQGFIGIPPRNFDQPSPSMARANDRRLLEQQALGFKPRRRKLLSLLLTGLNNSTQKAFRRMTKAQAN